MDRSVRRPTGRSGTARSFEGKDSCHVRRFPRVPPPAVRPLWVPPGLQFDELPPALQRGVTEIVNPAYDELVLEAQTALERSSGLTYVHLVWLELIEAIALGHDMGRTLPRCEGTDAHQEKMLRHMRLIGQKDRVAKFLLEVQRFYHKVGAIDPLGRLPR